MTKIATTPTRYGPLKTKVESEYSRATASVGPKLVKAVTAAIEAGEVPDVAGFVQKANADHDWFYFVVEHAGITQDEANAFVQSEQALKAFQADFVRVGLDHADAIAGKHADLIADIPISERPKFLGDAVERAMIEGRDPGAAFIASRMDALTAGDPRADRAFEAVAEADRLAAKARIDGYRTAPTPDFSPWENPNAQTTSSGVIVEGAVPVVMVSDRGVRVDLDDVAAMQRDIDRIARGERPEDLTTRSVRLSDPRPR